MTGIELWSTTAANNNSAAPNGFPEGMPPSGVNDAARQVMAAVRTWYEAAEWINLGYTPTYIGATSFSVVGDKTTTFQVGRRVKALGTTPFTIYGTIATSAYTSLTTVTVTWDSGSLDSSLTTAWVGAASVTNPSIYTSAISGLSAAIAAAAPFIDSTAIIKGSADATKLIKIEADGLTTGTTRTLTAQDKDITIAGISDINLSQDFRLTLTTGVPVTTSDVTGATTLYCTPYRGTRIALYDGTKWNVRTSAEFSLALGTLAAARAHDIFCYDNAGTPTLEFLIWTSDTARATALTYQDGILVKSGDATRRYLGTFRPTSTTQAADSIANRYLWNYYNRVDKPMRAIDSTDSWTYSTSTIRQANANTANQLGFVIGVSEDIVGAEVIAAASNSSANVDMTVAIGLDATNALAAGCINAKPVATVANQQIIMSAAWKGFPGVGLHFLSWLEYAGGSTGTFYGDNGGATQQSGIHGMIKC